MTQKQKQQQQNTVAARNVNKSFAIFRYSLDLAQLRLCNTN